jgi:CubicO group peptidase (beta-lactamase class C family)
VSVLNQSIAEQDHRFAAAFSILEAGIAEQAFPAASIAIVHGNDLIALRSFGRHTFDPKSPAVTPETVFDLASVSKVVATTTAAAILFQHGKLALDDDVAALAPQFGNNDLRRYDVTLRHLLTHTSGLPAYVRLFESCATRDELLAAAYATPLEADPGERTEYSDIGFIILGDIIEKLAEEPLDQFCQRKIFDQLGLKHTRFRPPAEWRENIAPTRNDQAFRHKIIQGEVNDENAWVMNGVAGHAGVFSTAAEVAEFAACWMQEETPGARSFRPLKGPELKPETIAEFTRQQPGTTRALGWDRPTPPSSSGRHFSPQSFGHLGYTGTSLWIDPTPELAVVLLTNRTWPDAKNQAIKQTRPKFHNAVIDSL